MPVRGNIDDLEYSKGHNYTINGHCSGCGECCSDTLPLSKSDIKRIKRYLAHKKVKAVNRGNCMELDCICPFLNKDNRCNIYEVRPKICRVYQCNKSAIAMAGAFTEGMGTYSMRALFFNSKQNYLHVVGEQLRMNCDAEREG